MGRSKQYFNLDGIDKEEIVLKNTHYNSLRNKDLFEDIDIKP